MTKKIFQLIFLILLIFFCLQKLALAVDCTSDTTNKSEDEIKAIVAACESKVREKQQQLQNISSELTHRVQKIGSLKSKINAIQKESTDISEEIDDRNGRINELDGTVNKLIDEVREMVVVSYKKPTPSLLEVIFSSQNVNNLINDYAYSKFLRQDKIDESFRIERVKAAHADIKADKEEDLLSLEEDKTLTEKSVKKEEVQVNEQKDLYQDTKKDEAQYQKMLSEAQAQLSSFKSFVSSAGGGEIGANGFGSGSNGWYYSQRDARWANTRIGNSKEIMLEVGCLVTSVTMGLKAKGVDWVPTSIATNPTYFFSNTAYFLSRSNFSWPNGIKYSSINKSEIRDKLKNGQPVIAGVYAGKYGTHFIVLFKLDGDTIIMHDPYYGPDLKFTDYYSEGRIFSAGIFY